MLKKLKNINLSQIIGFIKILSPFFIALLAIFSAFIYYFYSLNLGGVILSIILSIISIVILRKKLYFPPEQEQNKLCLLNKFKNIFQKKELSDLIKNISIFTYFSLTLAVFLELWQARTNQAIISPWELTSDNFFIFYFLASFVLLFIIYQNKNYNKNIKLISWHYFLSCIIALIIYKIGYGFDPFIHQAALEVISQEGFIAPKTPYYLGQYGLIISLHKIFGLSLAWLNKWLLAILAAWLLPSAIFSFTKKIIKDLSNNYSYDTNKSALLATTIILFFSVPLFIINTPQNLSYIFLILTIANSYKGNIIPATIFAGATLAIHPLAGIPAIIWIFWLLSNKLIQSYNKKTKIFLQILTSLTTSVLAIFFIPLSLMKLNNLKFETIKNNLSELLNNLSLKITWQTAGQENWWLNLNYFLYFNRYCILFLIILIGLIFILKHRKNKNINFNKSLKKYWLGLIIISFSLLTSSILSATISFENIIAYEQGDYANRLLIIALIFLSPFMLIAMERLIKLIIDNKKNNQLIWLIILSILLTNILYLSYPRFDKYYNTRGYSTSQLDIEAVKLISQKTQEPYLVLANQQVSAAALKLFGFNNYFSTPLGQIYFYPIPTGGPLYQYYLDMVYKNPSQETMTKAMNLVGVKQSYFIINKYWYASENIIEAAKISSNEWESLGQDDIFIFHYQY